MNKKIYILLLLSFCFIQQALHAQSSKNVIDEVAWVVGDEAIFKSDIEAFIRSERIQGNSIPSNAYCKYAEELALQKLFLHQADLDSIYASEEMISAMVNQYFEEAINHYGSVEKMEEYEGKSSIELKEQIREIQRNKSRITSVLKDIESKVHVSPADVRNYLKTLPEDSLPYVPVKVEVQLLVREPIVPQEEIDRVKSDLRNYTERINNGTPFSSLAILYSEDGSAKRGGEIGFTPKGALDPAFSAVAYALQDPTKVSKIVESEYGYHIIQLIEKRGDYINCRHILRTPKISDEILQEDQLRLDSVANDIRKGKLTFEQAVSLISDDKDTYQNSGLMQNEMTQTSRFEMEELPAEIAMAIDKMNINEISAPFLMRNRNGKQVSAIVKLKNRIPAHKASMSEDFQLLQNMVLQHRKAEARKKWIKEKQKKTFVHINENWKQCDFQYDGWQIR